MKKIQKNIAILLGSMLAILILIPDALSQSFQGMATYRSDRNMDAFQFQAEGLTPEMIDNMKAQMKKQFQRDYELKFNLTESTWEEAESLDSGPATISTGGMEMTMSIDAGLIYKNTENQLLLQQTESFSKLFLIKDQLEERDWQMTGKTKKIGDYTVYEATYLNVREVQSLSMSDEEQTTETISDTSLVSVWYTPDIPVPHGPEDYWGLPGLILELSNDQISYLCTKIELNPDKGIDINKPKKGKKVTADEFEEFSNQMVEEMMKKYSGGDEDGEHVMSIRVTN